MTAERLAAIELVPPLLDAKELRVEAPIAAAAEGEARVPALREEVVRDQAAAQAAEHAVVPEAHHARRGVRLVHRIDHLVDVGHRRADERVGTLRGRLVGLRALRQLGERVVAHERHPHVVGPVEPDRELQGVEEPAVGPHARPG